jgi:hypothetical protein
MKPPRVSLHSSPNVVLHAAEIAVKKHPHYRLAKAGDILAADALVADMANTDCMAPLSGATWRTTEEQYQGLIFLVRGRRIEN